MKKNLILILLSVYAINTFSQIQISDKWSKTVIEKANTAKDVTYLSDNEKEVILLMNLARLDGKLFKETFLEDYIKSGDVSATNSYVVSLKEDLKSVKDLTPLQPTEQLSKAAKYHAKDMGEKGSIGHTSSDGTSFSKRVRQYTKGRAIAENCSYGEGTPIGIVMQLLIDDGVPSLGHRQNILDNAYISVGVSIEKHAGYGFNCVMDFTDIIDQ